MAKKKSQNYESIIEINAKYVVKPIISVITDESQILLESKSSKKKSYKNITRRWFQYIGIYILVFNTKDPRERGYYSAGEDIAADPESTTRMKDPDWGFPLLDFLVEKKNLRNEVRWRNWINAP